MTAIYCPKDRFFKRMLDRLAACAGMWAIKRLFDPQCLPEDYTSDCVDCRAQDILRTMRNIAYGK